MRQLVDQHLTGGARTAPSKSWRERSSSALEKERPSLKAGKAKRHQRKLVEQIDDGVELVARLQEHAEPLPGRFPAARGRGRGTPAAAG